MINTMILVYLLLVVVVSMADPRCPDPSEPNPPIETREEMATILIKFSSSGASSTKSYQADFLTQYMLYMPSQWQQNYDGGKDLIKPCIGPGTQLTRNNVIGSCNCFPTSAEMGVLQMLYQNQLNGMLAK